MLYFLASSTPKTTLPQAAPSTSRAIAATKDAQSRQLQITYVSPSPSAPCKACQKKSVIRLTLGLPQTTRVQDTSLADEQRKEAMEFLIHFLGDITQPLHDEAEEVGGNDIDVTWDGTKTNLHACWDTQMVEKIAGGKNSTATIDSFAASLITQIDSGTYAGEKDDWVSCADITTASDCATVWAQDANAFNCEYVLKTNESGVELDGDYFTGAQPYIELQIAKGGYRLGTWLNNLAAAAA